MAIDRVVRGATGAAALLWAFVALGAGDVLAAGAGDAEALIREGVALRRAGNDVRALPLFQKAYETAHTPRTAAQLGLVEFALGYSLDAEQHLSQGLAVPTDSWIAKNRKLLDDTLTSVKATIGEVVVTGSPDGAEVVVNGRPAGRLPLAAPVRVVQGPATVEVKAAGYVPTSKPIDVAGGKSLPLAVQLQPLATAAAPGQTSEAHGQTPAGDDPHGALDASPSAPERHAGVRLAAWITGGGAVVALGTGLILRSSVQSRLDSFNGSCRLDPDTNQPVHNPDRPVDPNANCQNLYDSWHSLKNWPAVGYVTAGTLAVASGVLFWMARPKPSADTRAAFQCQPGPGTFSCWGVF